MPRIKISELKNYPFKTKLTVRVSDLNYGAHLGHDYLLSLAHQARLELFGSLEVTETDLGDNQTGIVVADVAVQYRGEAFAMDKLVIEISAQEVGFASFRFAYRVTNETSGRPTALIDMGFAAFDYESRRSGRLPAEFKAKLESL